ncbi:MAG: hypothetical protein FVQ81_00145 [Candidatus Glassbacteria bacterium]|nr:hypothetical protein [Candidatus Glassbacteria bacterium]
MKKNTITIMMVSNRHEPLTIEISIKEVVLAFVLVICLATAAVYSMVNYNRLKTEHQQLAGSARILREQLVQREARVDSLRSLVEKRRGAVLVIGANGDTMEVSPGSYSKRITIEELMVMPEQDSLKVSFRLVNNGEDESVATGYLVLLAEHDSGILDRYGTYPDFQVLPGNALNFTSGDSYAIRRFKLVEVAIPLEDRPASYSRLKVLVFDHQGELLLYQDLRLNV